MSTRNYKPVLTLEPASLNAGDHFDVHGSDFDQQYGNVLIGFTGGGWGSPVADDGTFTITQIPALSGDTLPSGDYPVTAYQHVKGMKQRWQDVAEATLTVK